MARDALAKHIAREERTCAVTARDAYRSYLATCLVEGLDVGSWLVRSGCALSFVRDARTDDADVDAARKAAVGIWGGSFHRVLGLAPAELLDRSRRRSRGVACPSSQDLRRA